MLEGIFLPALVSNQTPVLSWLKDLIFHGGFLPGIPSMHFEKYEAYFGRLAFAVSMSEEETVPIALQAVIQAN